MSSFVVLVEDRNGDEGWVLIDADEEGEAKELVIEGYGQAQSHLSGYPKRIVKVEKIWSEEDERPREREAS